MTLLALLLLTSSLGVLALVTLAWCVPPARGTVSVGALCAAAGVAIVAMLATYADHVTAERVTATDSIGFETKELVLREGFSDGLPRLGLAVVVLTVGCVSCIVAFRTRRARLLALLAVALLLAPIGWLGTRGIGLHARTTREAFAVVTPTDDGCLALDAAVELAGGMEQAESYEPNARRLAHACVASWLAALDRGGEEARLLEARAAVSHALFRLAGTTALDWLAASNLLVDELQRAEVARRQARTALSVPGSRDRARRTSDHP